MSIYRRDEMVKVTITARVYDHEPGVLTVRYHSVEQEIPLTPPHPATPSAVAVERVAPPNWPPQNNDVWRDRDGLLWLAQAVDDDPQQDGGDR